MLHSVRIATHLDVPTLTGLMRDFYAESNYNLDLAWAQYAFSNLLRDGARGLVLIAYEDDAAVGYTVLTFRFSMEFAGLDGFLDDLYVLHWKAFSAIYRKWEIRNPKSG